MATRSKRLDRLLRKVADVEGDHDFGVGPHSGGKDMPVLWIVGHPLDQGLVAGHAGIGKRPVHLGDAEIHPVRGHASINQVAAKFGENVGGPQRAICLSFGEPQQGVAQVRRI
jgi:hypothetical protein